MSEGGREREKEGGREGGRETRERERERERERKWMEAKTRERKGRGGEEGVSADVVRRGRGTATGHAASNASVPPLRAPHLPLPHPLERVVHLHHALHRRVGGGGRSFTRRSGARSESLFTLYGVFTF